MLRPDTKIPKSLKECYEKDKVSENLWNWSHFFEVCGKRLVLILAVYGIVSTIQQVWQIWEIDEELAILTLITSVVSWIMYIMIGYFTCGILALLVASLATIVQNTKTTSNLIGYKIAKDEGTQFEIYDNSLSELVNKYKAEENYWICKNCESKNNSGNICCKNCGKYK